MSTKKLGVLTGDSFGTTQCTLLSSVPECGRTKSGSRQPLTRFGQRSSPSVMAPTSTQTRTVDFPMRPEQEEAVDLTAAYYRAHEGDSRPPKFLWNAKMRFGKTFTTYQLAREMGWRRVLVLTYKPAVQAAWREDLLSHVDFEGWRFVDRSTPAAERETDARRPRAACMVRLIPRPSRTDGGRRREGA